MADPHNIFADQPGVELSRAWTAWREHGRAVLDLLPPATRSEARSRGLIRLFNLPNLKNLTGGDNGGSVMMTSNVEFHINDSGQLRPVAGNTMQAFRAASAAATRSKVTALVYFDSRYNPADNKTLARALGHELVHVADYHAGRITNFTDACQVNISEVRAYTWDRDVSIPGLSIKGLDEIVSRTVDVFTSARNRACVTELR